MQKSQPYFFTHIINMSVKIQFVSKDCPQYFFKFSAIQDRSQRGAKGGKATFQVLTKYCVYLTGDVCKLVFCDFLIIYLTL